MAVATLSVEAIIRERLRKLGCAENSFAAFNGIVGRTRFFEAMAGKPGKHFSDEDANKLSALISEMEEMESKSDAAIDWSKPDRVLRALTVRRMERYEAETRREGLVRNQCQSACDGIQCHLPAGHKGKHQADGCSWTNAGAARKAKGL